MISLQMKKPRDCGRERPQRVRILTSYSLSSWKIQAILVDKQQIPGILVGGKYPGVRLDFELLRNSIRLTVIISLKNRPSKICEFRFPSGIL